MYSRPSSFSYQRTSRSLVFTNYLDLAILHNCIYQASSPSFGKSQMLFKLQNTLYTLNKCGLCLSTNLLLRYNNEREKGEETKKEFSLKDEQLSLKWWVCCRNLFRVFYLNSLFNFVTNEGIYNMSEEYKSHT